MPEQRLMVYRVLEWGDGVMLDDVEFTVEVAEWARAVGYPPNVTEAAARRAARRNVDVLLRFQELALCQGAAFVAPLKLDDFEALGGDGAAAVSRSLSRSTIRFKEEEFPAMFLVSPAAIESPPLSGVQARVMCLAARQVLGEVSDQGMCDALGELGVTIARRTVNKYRRTLAENFREEVAPTAHFERLLSSMLSSVNSLHDLDNLMSRMRETNKTMMALTRPTKGGQLPRQWRAMALREWLLSGSILDPAARERLRSMEPAEQERFIAGVLLAVDNGLANGQ